MSGKSIIVAGIEIPSSDPIEITDLIGVRVLHLFKGQWKPISDYARTLGKEIEQPVAYHRAGDFEEILKAFLDSNLRTEVRVVGYRSVHHVIGCATITANWGRSATYNGHQ